MSSGADSASGLRPRLALAVIVLLGLLLGFHGSGAESYWLDEGFSVRAAHLGVAELVQERAEHHHPPLYFLLLRFWVGVFGDGEAATRRLSLLFGLLALPLLYATGRHLAGEGPALAATLLLALSPFYVQYAQETRGYSLLLLLAVAAALCLWRAVREGSTGAAAGLLLADVLLVYTHYAGWTVVLAQNLVYAAWAARRTAALPPRRWLLLQGLLLVAFVPWVRFAAHSVSVVRQGWWIPPARLVSIAATLREYWGSAAALALVAFLAIAGLLLEPAEPAARGSRRDVDARILLAAWLLLPVGVPFTVSFLASPVYWPRYTIAALPAFCLLAGRGVFALETRRWRAGVLVAAVLLLALALVDTRRPGAKEQWRSAAGFVAQRALPGDLVLLHQSYADAVFGHYFRRGDVAVAGVFAASPPDPAALEREVAAAVAGRSRVWLVLYDCSPTQGVVLGRMRSGYRELAGAAFAGNRDRYTESVHGWTPSGIRVLEFERR